MLYMALASIAFVAMHTAVRYVSQTHHPFETAFFRAAFGLIVLVPMFWQNGTNSLKTGSYGLLILRGVLNCGAMLCFFTGLSMTPLVEASALGFTAPIFATIMAMVFLKERVRLRRWIAIILGFAGTLVILRPGIVEVGLGPLLIIVSCLIWSGALMVIKVLTRTVSSLSITAWAGIVLTPLTLVAAWPYWIWPSGVEWLIFLFVGVMGTIAQTLMNESFKLADASVVMPVEFSKIIWATLFGFALFSELPDIYTWIGAAMIFASTSYIAWRESQLRKTAAKSK